MKGYGITTISLINQLTKLALDLRLAQLMSESIEAYERLKLNPKIRGLVWQPYLDELQAARKEDLLWVRDPAAWRSTRTRPLEEDLRFEITRFSGLEDDNLIAQVVYQFHRDIPTEVRDAIVEIHEIRDRLEQDEGIIPAPLVLPSEAFIGSTWLGTERADVMSYKKEANPGEDLSKVVVYNIPWQLLRIQLLSRFSEKGGFDTVEGVTENIQKLKSYIGGKSDINKVWRVLNLLNATRMGYAGQEEIGSAKDKLLVKYRDQISETYQNLKESQEFKPDSDADIRADVRKATPELLDKVYRDLRSRLKEKPVGAGAARARLEHFLKLIEKEKPSLKESSVVEQLIKPLIALSDDLRSS